MRDNEIPMEDEIAIANAKVTAEHHRQLREWGFVAHRDPSGRLSFIQRDVYAELVAAGKIEPGSAVQ
ncbi:MAG: hypothetical protein AB7K64_02005 [Variibacter sp.]